MTIREPSAVADPSVYFQQVVDHISVAITHLEAIRDESGQLLDFQIKFTNQAAGQLLFAEPAGHRLGASDSPSQATAFDYCARALATRQPVRFEHLDTNATPQRWLAVRVTPFGDGVLTTTQDITAQKQAELDSQRQADLLQSVIDNSPSALVLYEPLQTDEGEIIDFRYKLANPAAATVAGKSVADLVSSTLLTLYSQSNVSDLFGRLLTVQQTGDSQQFERYTELNGIELWANVTLVRQGTNVLAVLEFVTRLKQAQRQLEQQNSALARSNESLQSFAFIASHDLQEPLRKIQSFSNLLRTQYASVLDEQGDFLLSRMDTAAQRMSVLIRDLLALSRLTAQPLPFQPIDLNQIVADVLTDLETVVQEKNAQVLLDQFPTIQGDRIQLRQLFQNLLSNALKFTRTDPAIPPDPTRIRVTCQTVLREGSSPTASPAGYLITVADNGIGFDPAQAERIFGAFQRLHGRTQYDGTGIGLAIARKVVDNHGGTITAHSQPGQGATFTIYLPR